MASGRLNHSDALSFLQAIDTYGATLNTRSGDKARLIPANFSELSEVDQEVAVDEALSEWMEAEILRTRKGNSTRNLPPSLVSKNLSAIARLAGDKNVGKFRSFIRAIREYFGLALDRAHILRKGLASGEIDESNYDSFLNRLHGLTEQADLDHMARDAESAILDGIIDPEAIQEGDPFSLGRKARTFQEAKEQSSSFIGKPQTNLDDGLTAKVTGNTLRKMLSDKASGKSTSPEIHSLAVANIDQLFSKAIRTFADENTDKENLAARYRYHSPFIHEGTAYLAKLTVEAFKRQSDGTRIYTVESLEIVKPTTFKASSISEERRNYNRVAGFEEKLQSQFEELKQELSDQPKKSTRDSSPFAIGPSRLADLLRDDAASRIRNPEARAKALSRISRNLEAVRLEAERLEIGSKRLRKSLQREAAVRQAMRFEELENQALAQHSGILSNPLFPALRSSPTAVQEPPAKSKFLAVTNSQIPSEWKWRPENESNSKTFTLIPLLCGTSSALESAFPKLLPMNPPQNSLLTGLALAAGISLITPAFAVVNIDYALIGNTGNANDAATGSVYGAVAYAYKIAKNETTISQYAEFLNAVAKTDTYSLYSSGMTTSYINGITQSGTPGTFTYSVNPGSGNKPITYVSWFDAARFCNWMHNSQPTGLQTAATTEQGAYTLNGANSGVSVSKNVGATVWIPSESEWYKAAYYDPDKGGAGVGGYWAQATQSNTVTGNTIGVADSANYYEGDYATWTGGLSWGITDVGAYGVNSQSAYGTNDQTGNVWEWNDAVTGSSRGLRGGGWGSDSFDLPASFRDGLDPPNEINSLGFRVASVPEPSAVLLTFLAVGASLTRRRRSPL